MILAASVTFYAAWKPAYLLVLATPAVIDYFCALRIEDAGSVGAGKRWLALSIVSNLLLLGYFKYVNFFIDVFSDLTGMRFHHLAIVLPVGISFFIFKTLSYTIDVYRGELKATRSWWQYALFVSFFPELVAGPIVRASVFLPQLRRSLRFSWRRTAAGAQLILLGLTKKLVVADRLAVGVDPIFADPAAFSPFSVALGVFSYALQIYCDFSGYSDMAIGIAKIIGFDLPENFRLPYTATSITDFWRRWHITLSFWLRDYLYVPLGGRAHGVIGNAATLLITMFLGGLWHGANFTFVFWGALHGLALLVHRCWRKLFPAAERHWAASLFGWGITFLFVSFAWIFFRSRDFATAAIIVKKILGQAPGGVEFLYSPLFMLLPLVITAHVIGKIAERAPRPFKVGPIIFRKHPISGSWALVRVQGFAGAFLLTAWLLLLLLFATVNVSPFIYFQF
ncbi:MAG TPA: MBOAT family O-acyltransferase [Terriglobales bacterium]|nr:MBOAT family O-acyltransferase [Terriglobales bacterium]